MKRTFLAMAVTAAFALPFTVQAQGGGSSNAASGPSTSAGAANSPASPGSTSTPNVGASGRASTGASTSGTSGSMSGSASFSAVDTNNDGSISRAEWDAYHNRGAAAGATGSARGDSRVGGGAATPPGAGRGVGDNTQTPGNPNSASAIPSRDGGGAGGGSGGGSGK